MRNKLFIVLALILGLAASGWATPLSSTTYYLTVPNTALSPYAGPYATVEIDWFSTTQATVKVDALTGYLIGDGGSVALNIVGGNVTASNFSWLGGNGKTNYPENISFGQESDFGTFNFKVKGFDGYNSAVTELKFDLLNNSSKLWNDAASVLKNNRDGYLAAGHIFVAGDGGALQTGFAGNGNYTPPVGPPSVPEPSTLMLMGAGLLGLGLFRKKVK